MSQTTTITTGCNNCSEECVLINSDCLCKYTPLEGVRLSDIMDCVIEANDFIESCIGEECFKQICDEVRPENEQHISNTVRNSSVFKQLYTKLIYRCWLCYYGSGSSKAGGFIFKLGDEESNYRTAKPSELKPIDSKLDCKIEELKQRFVKFIQEKTNCLPCQKENDCACDVPQGCETKCACGRYDYCQCDVKRNSSVSNNWAAI